MFKKFFESYFFNKILKLFLIFFIFVSLFFGLYFLNDYSNSKNLDKNIDDKELIQTSDFSSEDNLKNEIFFDSRIGEIFKKTNNSIFFWIGMSSETIDITTVEIRIVDSKNGDSLIDLFTYEGNAYYELTGLSVDKIYWYRMQIFYDNSSGENIKVEFNIHDEQYKDVFFISKIRVDSSYENKINYLGYDSVEFTFSLINEDYVSTPKQDIYFLDKNNNAYDYELISAPESDVYNSIYQGEITVEIKNLESMKNYKIYLGIKNILVDEYNLNYKIDLFPNSYIFTSDKYYWIIPFCWFILVILIILILLNLFFVPTLYRKKDYYVIDF